MQMHVDINNRVQIRPIIYTQTHKSVKMRAYQ